MSEFEFVPATKEQAKARVALAGPSGSGKTWTALVLATVLAQDGRIAVIDTERGSASQVRRAVRVRPAEPVPLRPARPRQGPRRRSDSPGTTSW